MAPTPEEISALTEKYHSLSIDELDAESVRIKQEEGTNSRWKRLLLKDVREAHILREALATALKGLVPVEALSPNVMKNLLQETRRIRKEGDVVVEPDTAVLETIPEVPEIPFIPGNSPGNPPGNPPENPGGQS